ncbi:unnamed protein product [Zymoseptoria tritici ST99CH_3D1]|nr:unnamed protein product [Zymoseptoria tritici ST99CH_3D1]
MMWRFISLVLGLTAVASSQHEYSNPSINCSDLSSSFVRENVTIHFADFVAAGTNITLDQTGLLAECERPSQVAPVDLCRIAMNVTTSPRSEIYMEAWLPSNWTGRFLATGNGGLGGCVQYEDVAYGASLGFATVGSNNGHQGTRGLAFYQNADIVEDFSYRSILTETLVGKAITSAYYSNSHKKSYYIGCSTGGRQGFKMAQSFPTLFDGIVAGAPALSFNNLSSWSGHFYPITGSPDSPSYLPPSLWAAVHTEILTQCDSLDGVEDGILEDPSLCHYKPVSLLCRTNQSSTPTAPCLTAPQVLTVSAVLADYHGQDGALIFPRMQPGTELSAPYIYYNGQGFQYTLDWMRYAILQDPSWGAATLNSTYAAISDLTNPSDIETWNGDLAPFRDHGGKILHYHGLADAIITSENSPRYYEHVATTMNASPADLDEFYRFFRVGGMGHCAGGDGAWDIGQGAGGSTDPERNVLTRMVRWVEEGAEAAPEVLVGTKFVKDTAELGVELERKHCKWPLRNLCVDPGNHKSPEAWKCVP